MATTYEMGKKFKEETLSKIVFQMNSDAHKLGCWIEVLEKTYSGWVPSPWFKNDISALIVGNDKITYFLEVNTILHHLEKHISDLDFNKQKTSIGLNIKPSTLVELPNYFTNKKLVDKTSILHSAAQVLKNAQ